MIRSKTEFAAGFRAVAGRYNAVLCDVWGVIHNGVASWDEACAALVRFRQAGGTVVLLSNAPRPSWSVTPQLRDLGVPDAAYDGFVTSGDVVYDLLAADHRGARVYHLGPERDRTLFKDLDLALVGEGEADLIVCTGLFDDVTETPDDYRDSLERCRRRGIAMICANPDKVVERGDELVYCAGALADLYQELGGEALVIGKPNPEIYAAAFAEVARLRGGAVDRSRILAIGDSVRTDLAGAAGQGLDLLFVTGGIHGAELGGAAPDPEKVAALLGDAGLAPVRIQYRLVW